MVIHTPFVLSDSKNPAAPAKPLKALVSSHFAAILLLINCDFPKVSMSSTSHQNWTPPQRMMPAERLDEVAQILAAGLIRMFAGQSSSLSAPTRDSFIDFSPTKSGGHRRKLHNRVGG